MQKRPKSINEIFSHTEGDNRLSKMIRCTELDAETAAALFSSEMYIDATTTLLVTRGRAGFEINRRPVVAVAGTAVVMSASHLFAFSGCTPDFKALCLMVGEEFMTETDSADMIYRRIRYGVKLYDKPAITLGQEQVCLINDRLCELRQAIERTGHLYYRDVVLNRLFAFYLDLSDIIDRSPDMAAPKHSTRYESIAKRFIELLTANYRNEHTVEFYASRLNISAHYLTLIVKEITGRSVSDFVFGMLYADARALLSESGMSIQETASVLNFSDQSAFGKFFRRRSGMSPSEYRKKQR